MANEWIIITDDDPMSLQNARDMLCDHQVRVSTARSGKDLLKFMERHSPDLVLLDILMPEMDGFETYQRLRELEEKIGRRQTPVIFLTGENDAAAEQKGLMMGASDYVRKPFVQDILLRRIFNAIQNSRTIESLTEEATLDKLTGFLNKSATVKKMTEICQSGTGILAILDLDSFKLVNDIYGHEMGDRVLVTFADIVRKNTRKEDVVCRIGGDEFLVFFMDAVKESAVANLTKRLNKQLVEGCRALMGEEFDIPIGVSVGAVAVPQQGRDHQLLFSLADKALYRVKQNGKHGYAIYDPMKWKEKHEEALEGELVRITKILEERNESNSALWLGQDAFMGAYRFAKRFLRHSDGKAVKLLFLLSVREEGSENNLSAAEENFKVILDELLFAEDVVWQNKSAQYLVLLAGKTKQEAWDIAGEVAEKWKQMEQNKQYKLKYVVE